MYATAEKFKESFPSTTGIHSRKFSPDNRRLLERRHTLPILEVQREHSSSCDQSTDSSPPIPSHNCSPDYSQIFFGEHAGLATSNKFSTAISSSGHSNESFSPSIQVPRHRRFLSRNLSLSIEPSCIPIFTQPESLGDASLSNSTPSVIINKLQNMKEKIRRHVVSTTEWTHPSVIFADRYSSSVSAPPQTSKPRKLCRSMTTDSSTNENCNKNVKFRPPPVRRHKTVDINQTPPLYQPLTVNNSSVVKNNASGGIVCSEMEFKAIIKSFKDTTKVVTPEVGNVKKIASKSLITSPEKQFTQLTSSANKEESPSVLIKKSLFKRQISFDEKKYALSADRKVSVIEEEMELFAGTHAILPKTLHKQTSSEISDGDSCVMPNAGFNTPLPKEVAFDEHGQTWEVYGADLDPEILGIAIEKHLGTIIMSTVKPANNICGNETRLATRCSGNNIKKNLQQMFCLSSHASPTHST